VGKEVRNESLPEHLVRLAYADIILHHAEVDTAEEFTEKIQQDLKDSPHSSEDNEDEETRVLVNQASIWGRFISRLRSDRKFPVLSSLTVILIIPMLFLLLWSNLRYQDKILPGTRYASIELNSDPEEALKQIKKALTDYNFTLKFNDSEKTYSAEEVGVQLSPEETLNSAKVQSNQVRFFARPFALFGSRKVETVAQVNHDKLKSFLESQNYSDKLPEDAKIEFSSGQGKFVVIPEVAGRGIDSKSFSKKLEHSARELSKSTIDLEIEDVSPAIVSGNLATPLREANLFISQKFNLTSPNKNYIPSVDVMKDWISLSADPVNSTYKISYNEGSIDSYVDGLVKKINRKMEKKLYASINGAEILLQEGASGLQVSNTDSVKSHLLNLFKAKQGGSIAIEAREEAPTTENIAATGGRWIFADISQFKIYAYEGATLVNSFPMSSGKASTATPTGRYSVLSKVRVKTMTSGGNKNSKDYYSVPNIEWVAYFKAGGYAMHGVYWHNKFGIENTSHGCMGMSNTNAHWVYDFVDIGTPVIVVP